MTASYGFMRCTYLMQAIDLQNLPFNPLWLLSVPVFLYLLISSLRFLGKLRVEHENILEASLKAKIAPPPISAREKSIERKHIPTTQEQALFPSTLTPPLHSELKAS